MNNLIFRTIDDLQAEYSALEDWGLILSERTVGSPEPKIMQMEIEGRSGNVDFTDYFGDVKYNNRLLSFIFTKAEEGSNDFHTLFSTVHNAIHGKKMDIIFSDDPAHYFRGRVQVKEWKSNRRIGTIAVEVDAEPWKYDADTTVVSGSGSQTFELSSGRMPVVPIITSTASATFTFNGKTYSHDSGVYQIPEIQLVEGINMIGVSSSGTVRFAYREGNL